MSIEQRPNRRITRPYVRRGTSGVIPARRHGAQRTTPEVRLLSTSDQMMWWGWAVAVAFVMAGLLWHLFTYQQETDQRMAQPSEFDEQVVECSVLDRK